MNITKLAIGLILQGIYEILMGNIHLNTINFATTMIKNSLATHLVVFGVEQGEEV
jgi:hypothetical protein